jgi:hypothetical protein
MGDRLRTSVKAVLVLQRSRLPDRAGGGTGLPDQKRERAGVKADQAIGRFALDEPQHLDTRLEHACGGRRIVSAWRFRSCASHGQAEDCDRDNADFGRPGRSKVTRHAGIVCAA